jgi:SLOG family YspA-like protein
MKVIIAGSRSITDLSTVIRAIVNSGFKITEEVCGCANGVDVLGSQWADINKIPIKHFPAKWDLHGRSAGYVRNQEMAKYADALVAVWDGKSKGTGHMIDIMVKENKQVFLWET